MGRVEGTSEDWGGTQGLVTAGSRYYPWAEGTRGVTILEPTAGGGQRARAVALGAEQNQGPASVGGCTPTPLPCPPPVETALWPSELKPEGNSPGEAAPEASLPYRSDGRAEDATAGSLCQGRSGLQPTVPSAGVFICKTFSKAARGSLALRVHANSPARPFFPDHPEPPASALVSLSPKSCHVSEQFSASELMVLIPSENYPVTTLALAASLSPKPITSRRRVLYRSCPPRAHC